MPPPPVSGAARSSKSSKCHEGHSDISMSSNEICNDNPHLSRLLKQLRPFQREAYDYAIKGVVNSRQFRVPKNLGAKTNKRRKKPSGNTNHPTHSNGPNKSKETKPRLNGRLLLADEMGLGKSITSLAIMCHYMSEWPLLILCPASLRHIWPNEIEKFLPGLPASCVYVVQGFDDADFYENERKRRAIKIVVATYSLLQKRSASARCLQDFQFQCVIADESHNLKQKDSQRTQLAMPLLKGAKRLALLSGTPALARPVELWTQLYCIDPDLFGSYTNYTKQYCNAHRGRFGWDVSGLSNADDLHSKLKQVMVRRLKADVLDELPSKQRSLVPITISNKTKRKECEALMKELRDTRQSVADLVGDEASGAHFEARKLLMEAYQASGIAKASAVSEYLVEWLRGSGTQKVLIFAHHKGVLDSLEVAVAKELKGGGHIRIDGSVNSQERAVRVNKFQSCSKIRVAILSMTAAGVGLTLTAASCVMFAELHWTPGVLAQAEDRCHRIGQRNAVNVLYLVCEDSNLSVDMQLWQMLGRKVSNLGRVVDGERNANMGARKAEKNGVRAGGVSVQDELQSFFAETQIRDEKIPKVPAKGTIMSFFAKQQQKTPQSSSKASTGIRSESGNQLSKTLPKPSIFANTSKGSLNMVEWDCNVCTFHNKKCQHYSDVMTCEICGTQHKEVIDIDDQESSSRKVTPASGRKGDSENSKESNQLSQSSASHHESQITGPTRPEIVTIDEIGRQPIDVTPRKLDSSLQNPIVLCNISEESYSPRKKRKVNQSQTRISSSKEHGMKETKPATILLFSVSKNSGRITIHFDSGESSLTNFQIEHIVTETTADRLMEARLSRTQNALSSLKLEYDKAALTKVIESLDATKLPHHVPEATLIAEVENFVDQFMLLREVEKKLLKESGNLYSGINLRQEVLRLMPRLSESTTERYLGGAKERARERVENGTADDKDMAILEGRCCAYCGGELSAASRLPGVSSTYCSRECADQGRLKRGWGNQLRSQVFVLEGGVCRICGIDGHALFTRVLALEPAERLNALCNANWKLPKSAKALDRLLQNPKEGDFWQADHILAVAEGGGSCGLENLRTLCVPCHAVETEKLHSRLKLHKTKHSEEQGGPKKQLDIRSMFKSKRQS